jgi:hypothetical protein
MNGALMSRLVGKIIVAAILAFTALAAAGCQTGTTSSPVAEQPQAL